MKAIVCTKYGPPDTLKLGEVPKPTLGDDEVLVEGHGGIIEGQIKIGESSDFTVRLPADRGKDEQEVNNSRGKTREKKIQHMDPDSITVDSFGFGSWWLFLAETRRA